MATSSNVVQSRPSPWRHRLKSIAIAWWKRCRHHRCRRNQFLTIFIHSFHTFRLFLFRSCLWWWIATRATHILAPICAISRVIFLLLLWTFIGRCAAIGINSGNVLLFSFDQRCRRSGWHSFVMVVTAMVVDRRFFSGHNRFWAVHRTFRSNHCVSIQFHQLFARIAQMLDAMFHMIRTE